jgi:transcriptional antiterminator RfaH
MDALKWRCVRGKPKAEHLAARQLVASGFEAFCPRLRHQKKTVRGLVWYVEALFPGYLFARFSPASLRHVAATPFVSQVLSFMEDFGAVPDSVITDLRSAVDADDSITVPMEIEVGEEVDALRIKVKASHEPQKRGLLYSVIACIISSTRRKKR